MCLHNVFVFMSFVGLEFTAVFLCTTEPYDVVRGKPVPRKQAIGSSIMNKRVFNTVLTRAKALFIAFGNPFYLMNAEGDSDCWREYIKRCTESDSFVFEQQPSDRQKELLLNQVFQNPVNKVSQSDTFLEQYAKEFIEQLEFDGSHWQITKPDTEEEEGDTVQARDDISGIECILEYHSMKYAEAVPTSKELRKKIMFAIQGMKSRGQALHGATVLVQPVASKTERLGGLTLIGGMVVHVKKQSEEQLFLCKIDPFNSSRFIPLNEKGPKLANLPPISSKLLQLEKAKSEIEESKHKKINPVPCFDLHQLAKGIPKLKDVIPFETAKKLLFLVKFMSWPKGRFFPMAGVVEVFPGVHSTFCAAQLSTAIAKLSTSSQHPNDHTSSLNDQFNINNVKKALECSSNCKLANVEIVEFSGKDINFSSKDICDESLPIGLKYLTLGSVFETFTNSSNRFCRSKWKFKIISTKSPKEFLDIFTNFKELKDPAAGDTLVRHRELNTGDEIQISLVITRSDGSQIRRFNASTPKKMSSSTSSTASVNSAHEYRTIGKSSIAPFLNDPIGVYQFEISCNLTQKEILPVWIGADTSTPISKPEIQLISPGPYLEICVPHSVRPGECFSNPILRQASLDKYSNIQQYQDLWKAVITAESAYSSSADQNSEVLFLDNILLDWGESKLKRVNSLMNDPTYQSHGVVVSFSLSSELLNASGQFISLQPGDFICARYGPQLSPYSLPIESMQKCQKSVFHFVVKAIDHKEDSSQLVKLEMIGEQNAHISENMFNVLRKEKFQLSCRLQIINCPIPQR